MNKTIGIIGCGNMGGAIYRELFRQGFSVFAYDKSYAKARSLAKNNAINSLAELLKKSNYLIIAVKPQSFAVLAATLQGQLSNKLIISIMAGVKIKAIEKLTGATKIVRAMPNLPAQIGMGVTEWISNILVSKTEKIAVQKILNSFGMALEVKTEDMLGKLTTISGCGPAYFFYLTELLAKQARAFGLNEKEAEQIAAMTLVGSAKLLENGVKSAAEWRESVTSKKGVTEAVLKHLMAKKWAKIFFGAIKKGKLRNDQLSK